MEQAGGTTTTSRTALLATLALLAITACWGSTFFLIHDLLDRVPVLDFLALRFAMASLVVLLIAPRSIARLSPTKRKNAVVVGVLYGVAQILQTAGLGHTSASVGGFITGLYVVATPLFAALLLSTRITGLTWAAVLLAMGGLAVLTLDDPAGLAGVGYGEVLIFLAALLYALHIVGLGAWSSAQDAVGMALIQCLVIAVVCGVAAAPGGIELPTRVGDWLSITYMAVFAGAGALLGQTWAQAHLPPTRTAIIMTMEPVFAAFFAVLLGGESASLRMLLGGAFVLAAMLLVELGPRRKAAAEVPHLTV
jgi:drug/metabolite transporter (DMT)-like permease